MPTRPPRPNGWQRRWRGWAKAMKLDHAVILVRSLDSSLPWYAAMLGAIGFAKTRDHVWLSDDGFAIDLKQANPDPPDYQRYAPGLNHLGFTAPDEAALDAVRAAMIAAGFEVPDKQHFGSTIATFFRDPDGMRVEVTVYG